MFTMAGIRTAWHLRVDAWAAPAGIYGQMLGPRSDLRSGAIRSAKLSAMARSYRNSHTFVGIPRYAGGTALTRFTMLCSSDGVGRAGRRVLRPSLDQAEPHREEDGHHEERVAVAHDGLLPLRDRAVGADYNIIIGEWR